MSEAVEGGAGIMLPAIPRFEIDLGWFAPVTRAVSTMLPGERSRVPTITEPHFISR